MNHKKNSTEKNDDTVGILLSTARKSAGLSVDDIASRMNLSLDVIIAIEADDYRQSLSPAFYRGYLRTYAQIVDIESDALIQLFNRSINQDSLSTSITPTFDTDLYTQRERKLPILKWFSIVTSVVVLSVVAYFISTKQFFNGDDQQPEIPLQNKASDAGFGLDLSITDVMESDTDTEEQDALIVAEADTDEAEIETKAEPLAMESVEPIEVITEAPVLESSVKLIMNFSGDCWVKVTDNTGEVLALGIKRTGKIMELAGDAPFNIILGNPAVVDIRYNEETVDLSSFAVGNRVELELSASSKYLQ